MTFLFAATVGDSCSISGNNFFFIPHWWEYLKTQVDVLGQCSPVFSFPNDILSVGLAVLDMMLRLAGFLAVVAIIIAGAQFIFAGGDTQKVASARKWIINGIIGLIIALTATAVVTYIGGQLG